MQKNQIEAWLLVLSALFGIFIFPVIHYIYNEYREKKVSSNLEDFTV